MDPCVSASICLLLGYIPAYHHYPRVLEYVLGNRKAFMKGPDSNYLCLGEEKKNQQKTKREALPCNNSVPLLEALRTGAHLWSVFTAAVKLY